MTKLSRTYRFRTFLLYVQMLLSGRGNISDCSPEVRRLFCYLIVSHRNTFSAKTNKQTLNKNKISDKPPQAFIQSFENHVDKSLFLK